MPPVPTPPDPVSALQAKAAELGIDAIEQVTSDADGILKRLLGPIAEEAGQMIAMPLREKRLVKTAKMLRRVEEKIQVEIGNGAERETVPARGVIPLVEAASLEDDEELSERYADLLANAALGKSTQDIAAFAQILRQLSPDDARLLQYVFSNHIGKTREIEKTEHKTGPTPTVDLRDLASKRGAMAQSLWDLPPLNYSHTPEKVRLSADNLFRLGLLKDLSTADVLVEGRRRAGLQIRRGVTWLGSSPFRGTNPADLPDRIGSSSIFQPDRRRVALSELGFRFSVSVNPPGIHVPSVGLSDR